MKSSKSLRLGLAALAVGIGAGGLALDAGGGSARAEVPVAQSDAVQRKADAVFESFGGSRIERDAGAVLAAYALNGGMDRCLAAKGFPEWDWSMPRAQNPVSHGLESSVFFAEPLARSFTTAVLASGGSMKADTAARTVVLDKDEDAAVGECLQSVQPVSEAEAAPTPPVAARLREQWWSMLRDLDDKFGDQSTFAECLSARPVAGLGAISSSDDAAYALADLVPSSDLLPSSTSDPKVDGDGWQRLLEAEAAWEQADWECRGTVHNNHLSDVAVAIDQFAVTHATEIAQARRAWADTLVNAEALGFDGSYGPLGN